MRDSGSFASVFYNESLTPAETFNVLVLTSAIFLASKPELAQ